MSKTIENQLIGKLAKADHPITCINPHENFVIKEVRVEYDITRGGHNCYVRGEETAWFGINSWELV